LRSFAWLTMRSSAAFGATRESALVMMSCIYGRWVGNVGVNFLIRVPLALSSAACNSFIVCATSARLARVNERPAMLYDAPATAIALRQAVKSPCNSCRVASGRPKNDFIHRHSFVGDVKKKKRRGD
jgi:hypothetical protein